MQLIKKLGTIPAKTVTDFEEIREDAFAMLDALDKGFERDGKYTTGAALHHAQVSETPYNFFVVADQYKGLFGGGRLRRIIINPHITDQKEYVPFTEGCLSFFNRDHISTKRFNEIRLEAQHVNQKGDIRNFYPRQMYLTGFPAFLVQHECDHAAGNNIYDGRFDEYNPRVELSKEQ